ncbi:inactive tyrosine-protein kinase PEAK1-like [Xyrauchen texanus]|uniref:inactive tyrosine-protein kinase PEAK1-like n=1 Tax=Xyrauchen texanus TaxID=154827 RepID=UPI002241BA12|nr:inactive tyrosine-protein kinase PEAK1-like [Xyrauchen texanus]
MLQHCPAVMSACNTFTEHVWKPGECKNCFKPKSLHWPPEQANESKTDTNAKLANSCQRSISSSRAGQVRPPVAKKPTIAVKPTMMLPCSPPELDSEGNYPRLADGGQVSKSSPFTIWNHKSLNSTRLAGTNNNQGEYLVGQTETYGAMSMQPASSNNNNGLTDVLKEIAGLESSPSSSRDEFFGRICSLYRRSLERGLPASSCFHAGSGQGAMKRVSLSDSAEIISSEGGRFCYPEFSSDGDDEDDESGDEDDDGEHDSWDESDEELLAMGIRMRGQPRFANFRAATLSPVPFDVGKKWNTVPLRNRSLQRFCAVDYDDSYDEILNGYPSVDSNGAPGLRSYGSDHQGSDFLSTSDSNTSPESLTSLPEDSCTVSIRDTGDQRYCLSLSSVKEHSARGLSSPKSSERHKAVLAIRLEDQDDSQREGGAIPQALPGQPITISFSPTEEQAKPYRVVNLEKAPICKPYTVVDVSASMATKDNHAHCSESVSKPSIPSVALNPSTDPGHVSATSTQSPRSPVSLVASPSLSLSLMPQSLAGSPTAGPNASRTKPGSIRYQEVWTSCTSPRQKIPKVDLTSSSATSRLINHKSAPTSPTACFGSARTVPTKSPNLSEIKFNSYNNAGMPPFPIIIRDEPVYARSSKKAVKVPIVINPSAYDNLAVYKSFLGLNGKLPHSKPEAGERVSSHTYEEIGSSESTHPSTTEQTPQLKHSPDTNANTELRTTPASGQTVNDGKARTTTDLFALPTGNLSPSPTSAVLTHSSLDRSCNPSGEQPPEDSREGQVTSSDGSGQREKASAVPSQIVASIQPPPSPPDTPAGQSKTCCMEELYSMPPDASRDTLSRPKLLHCSAEPHKDMPPKLLPKSQSASAAVHPTSPRYEPSAPLPPVRSSSSPYHSSNLLQRHFSNWTRPTGAKPCDGETSPGAEGKRSAYANKPKRWISFKSFFRRRKDDDEQKEKIELEKEKGKLLGLDGTVITVLPPPPVQRQHWFAESKTDDPHQKPTIIFTYKSESTMGGEEAELRVEEHKESSCVTGECGASNLSTPPKSRASLLISKVMNQLPVQDTEISSATSLPAKLELSPLREQSACCPPPASPTSHSSRQAEREEEETAHTISHSSASSSCRATYTNLGQSRANMIPVKHPRHPKTSDDTLASDPEVIEPISKATPPPLPKKSVPRVQTESSTLGIVLSAPRPKGEARPGRTRTNLSVANPLYDLESTWDTASQSSSLSSEAQHLDESGDSLERPSGGRSLSCLTNNSFMQACDRRGYQSTDSLTARTRGAGRPAKAQKDVVYRGIESWEEVVGRIRGLHTDTLRKLATRCEDRFMAGQKDHLRFGTDSWSHFRLTAGKPCCEAGDAVYYTASFAKEPLMNYAVKICRGVVKETQQQFFHSLAVRQSIAIHFNIQQDCGHFLADVPARLLPWESEEDRDEERGSTVALEKANEEHAEAAGGKLCNRVVVITREVPFQTMADFVREGVERHSRNSELYERQVCLLLLQLCAGLEHMKPYHVTHCDLRLENLLLAHSQPGNLWNHELLETNNNTAYGPSSAAASACPARLIISNFSQAKLKNATLEPAWLQEQSRLAPELITATQYRKCDEFQTGILIYEMLHRSNPFEESPQLKEREYCSSDLPQLPLRSLYSNGLQQLATLLLNPNPSERIQMADARACLQCLLWGPREDLFNSLNLSAGPVQRHVILQNWLDLKQTLMMIKFAERSLDSGCGVSLEDWLCCQYLAFATTESLSRVIKILQQPQGVLI